MGYEIRPSVSPQKVVTASQSPAPGHGWFPTQTDGFAVYLGGYSHNYPISVTTSGYVSNEAYNSGDVSQIYDGQSCWGGGIISVSPTSVSSSPPITR